MGANPETEFFKSKEKLLAWAKKSIDWLKTRFGENNIIKTHLKSPKTDSIQKIENSLGKIDEFENDALGNVLSTITYDKDNPEDFIKTINKYDAKGNIVAKIDGNGNETKFTYDGTDKILTKTDNVSGKELTTTYTYDAVGNLDTVKDYRGNITSYKYDEINQKIETIDAFGKSVERIEYKPEDAMIVKYDALGNKML